MSVSLSSGKEYVKLMSGIKMKEVLVDWTLLDYVLEL